MVSDKNNSLSQFMVDRFYYGSFGTIQFSLDELREWQEAGDVLDEDACVHVLELPLSEECLYNYTLCRGEDGKIPDFSINQIYCVDRDGDVGVIAADQSMIMRSLRESFEKGDALVCGVMAANKSGGVFFSAMYSGDIVVDCSIDLTDFPDGILFVKADYGRLMRVWIDEEARILYVAPEPFREVSVVPS